MSLFDFKTMCMQNAIISSKLRDVLMTRGLTFNTATAQEVIRAVTAITHSTTNSAEFIQRNLNDYALVAYKFITTPSRFNLLANEDFLNGVSSVDDSFVNYYIRDLAVPDDSSERPIMNILEHTINMQDRFCPFTLINAIFGNSAGNLRVGGNITIFPRDIVTSSRVDANIRTLLNADVTSSISSGFYATDSSVYIALTKEKIEDGANSMTVNIPQILSDVYGSNVVISLVDNIPCISKKATLKPSHADYSVMMGTGGNVISTKSLFRYSTRLSNTITLQRNATTAANDTANIIILRIQGDFTLSGSGICRLLRFESYEADNILPWNFELGTMIGNLQRNLLNKCETSYITDLNNAYVKVVKAIIQNLYPSAIGVFAPTHSFVNFPTTLEALFKMENLPLDGVRTIARHALKVAIILIHLTIYYDP